eukprot:SAG11_NODE_303_length_11000_cov_7.979635_7_plen_101_part_00
MDDLLADPQEQDDQFVGSQSGKSREELRASCKLYKLSTRGSKADLAARVEEKLREEAALIGDSSSEDEFSQFVFCRRYCASEYVGILFLCTKNWYKLWYR